MAERTSWVRRKSAAALRNDMVIGLMSSLGAAVIQYPGNTRNQVNGGPDQMRPATVLLAISLFSALANPRLGFAEDAAISTMAKVMIDLEHHPSDSDKETLTAIAASSDSSEAEKAVATAIANIVHRASVADRERLNAIAADDSTPTELRDLATIVRNTTHRPSASDVAKLEEIVAAHCGELAVRWPGK